MPQYSLGRKVEHDPLSLFFAHPVLPKSAIRSMRWTRRVGVFDQGNLGSCVGNATAGVVATDTVDHSGLATVTLTDTVAARTRGVFKAGTYQVDEDFAVLCYELATRLDRYPGTYKPDDTGSSGLAGAKVLETLGLADRYTHGFIIDALDTALQSGPVLVGLPWLNSMFTPAADGRIPVDQNSGVAGGHELCMDTIDVENGRYWVTNSWGEGWGQNGRGYFTRTDLAWLLSQQGDVTVPHLIGSPAPVPPQPTPQPGADPDVLAAYRALQKWAVREGVK